jgi:hypothetical protein
MRYEEVKRRDARYAVAARDKEKQLNMLWNHAGNAPDPRLGLLRLGRGSGERPSSRKSSARMASAVTSGRTNLTWESFSSKPSLFWSLAATKITKLRAVAGDLQIPG